LNPPRKFFYHTFASLAKAVVLPYLKVHYQANYLVEQIVVEPSRNLLYHHLLYRFQHCAMPYEQTVPHSDQNPLATNLENPSSTLLNLVLKLQSLGFQILFYNQNPPPLDWKAMNFDEVCSCEVC